MKTAELNIKRIALPKLKPHPRNPRVHPDPGTPEWDTLKRSLAMDYFDPIVFNTRNGMLVSGHLRVKVMRAEKYTHADAVVVDYDENTHLARMIAANKSIGNDDRAALKDLLQEMDTGAVDMAVTGYSTEEIEDLMTQFHIERPGDDRAGASPWDRVGDAKEGVMFSFGVVQARVSTELHNRFAAQVQPERVGEWLNESLGG